MNNTIRKSWLNKYEIAKQYYEEYNDLLVKRDCIYKGVALGRWIIDQRYDYRKNRLNPAKIKKLEEIGMVWQLRPPLHTWNEGYELAKTYYEEHGNLVIPPNYTIDDFNLSNWVKRQRILVQNKQLSKSNIEKLNDIKMIWDTSEYIWKQNYHYAEEYYEKYGHLNVPTNYKINNFGLYSWLRLQKIDYRSGKLDAKKVLLLEKLEINWNSPSDKWMLRYAIVKEFYKQYGHLDIPKDYIVGFNLRRWLQNQINKMRKNELDSEKTALLKDLDIGAKVTTWDVNIELAKNYYIEHGNLLIPRNYEVNGIKLGRWISSLRLNKDTLSEDKIKALEEIGMRWQLIDYTRKTWEESYAAAKEYYSKYQTLIISKNFIFNGINLDMWLSSQKKYYKQGKLSDEKIKLLEDIGIVWNMNNYKLFKKDLSKKTQLLQVKKRLTKILYDMLKENNDNYNLNDVEQDYIKRLGLK